MAEPDHVSLSLCGRAPDVFSPWAFWSIGAQVKFHAVAFSQHVDALTVDRALVKEIFSATVAFDEPESLLRTQRLNLACHLSTFALSSDLSSAAAVLAHER